MFTNTHAHTSQLEDRKFYYIRSTRTENDRMFRTIACYALTLLEQNEHFRSSLFADIFKINFYFVFVHLFFAGWQYLTTTTTTTVIHTTRHPYALSQLVSCLGDAHIVSSATQNNNNFKISCTKIVGQRKGASHFDHTHWARAKFTSAWWSTKI